MSIPNYSGLRNYPNSSRRANATFVMLARNSDIKGVISSIQSAEDRFNRFYSYPWVLLNDEPFTDEFKERVSVLTRASISFGLIPEDHWLQPEWIDEQRASDIRQKMMAKGVMYGGDYRNMCRFNSGFFFQHELLQQIRQVPLPETTAYVKFFCDLDYDPFLYMQDHDKVYGFAISILELKDTILSLWQVTKEFIAKYPQYVENRNAIDLLSDDGGASYNLCHFWSNFEIADMDFWRSEAYTAYFSYLERTGGFYYERWGDAPVHSIAVALFARREQIHFFHDIGYQHGPLQNCPSGQRWGEGRCSCNPTDTFGRKITFV
ncbi:glycosyltransferase family 15 protein [Rhodocollybia butyracea]|uniref:Glycosyltransferase family 15 protein n=1 Tax=Rhodocollybia butyracea TaxID=206335 RepID=A0A9P5Q843_9AGAR|nr:glycosyltransferase family 15 protein [Rhodocollybia butyracea]